MGFEPTTTELKIIVYCLNITCLPGLHHNDFMAAGVLCHTDILLHVAGIQEQKESSNYQ